MKIIRSLKDPVFQDTGCVLTIGNFDAMHLGHQQMIEKLSASGYKLGLPTVMMTFSPSAEEYFQQSSSAPRLTSVSSRCLSIADQRVDVLIVLPFNETLANTSAQAFIENILLTILNVRYLLVGDDFRFGTNRAGDFSMLREYSKHNNFKVERMSTIEFSGERISSTRIRNSLRQGDLAMVSNMLGRHYFMTGRVAHGDKRGRQWGFPTLNLPLRKTPPLTGVYAVWVSIEGGKRRAGVANLGNRPTVDGIRTLLEVHLFNFEEEIYGQRICVEFVEKIRDEQRFESFELLQKQIFKDCDSARRILMEAEK